MFKDAEMHLLPAKNQNLCHPFQVRDGRAERFSATGEGGQAAVSLTPEMDGTGSGFLLEADAFLHL